MFDFVGATTSACRWNVYVYPSSVFSCGLPPSHKGEGFLLSIISSTFVWATLCGRPFVILPTIFFENNNGVYLLCDTPRFIDLFKLVLFPMLGFQHLLPPSDEGGGTALPCRRERKNKDRYILWLFSPSVSLRSTVPSSEGANLHPNFCKRTFKF